MDAVIATAAEHRRSWPRYLDSHWFPDLPDTPSVPPDLAEYQTITRHFADRVI